MRDERQSPAFGKSQRRERFGRARRLRKDAACGGKRCATHEADDGERVLLGEAYAASQDVHAKPLHGGLEIVGGKNDENVVSVLHQAKNRKEATARRAPAGGEEGVARELGDVVRELALQKACGVLARKAQDGKRRKTRARGGLSH